MSFLHSNVDFYFKFDEYSKFEYFVTALIVIVFAVNGPQELSYLLASWCSAL